MTYDQFLCALCIWREARGEAKAAKRAVWWVIRNRQSDHRWPDTLAEVVLQPKQFSSFNARDANAVKFPPNSADRAWGECVEVVESPGVDDPTLGANHYHSIPDGGKLPAWALASKITGRIGAFTFYKL